MSEARAARLHRLAHALEARRRLAVLCAGALDRDIAACRTRQGETLAFAETTSSSGPIGRALTRRLADLERHRLALLAERAAAAERGRRDRRLARGVERLASRLDADEARRSELAELEAWLDAASGATDASLPPARPPSLPASGNDAESNGTAT